MISRSKTPTRLKVEKTKPEPLKTAGGTSEKLKDLEVRVEGLTLQPQPQQLALPAGDELVLSSAQLVPRAFRLHLRAEPSRVLGPRRLAGTRKRDGNDSGGEVENRRKRRRRRWTWEG